MVSTPGWTRRAAVLHFRRNATPPMSFIPMARRGSNRSNMSRGRAGDFGSPTISSSSRKYSLGRVPRPPSFPGSWCTRAKTPARRNRPPRNRASLSASARSFQDAIFTRCTTRTALSDSTPRKTASASSGAPTTDCRRSRPGRTAATSASRIGIAIFSIAKKRCADSTQPKISRRLVSSNFPSPRNGRS